MSIAAVGDDGRISQSDYTSPTLFQLPPIEKGGGAVTLSQVKAVPLPHPQTAELLKSPDTGIGRIGGFAGGTFEVVALGWRDGRITWTIRVDDLQLDL